jgi:hypothetical protein
MFTLLSWARVQNLLVADPAYAGMMPGKSIGRVRIVWRQNAKPGPAARDAVELLHSLGIATDQETTSAVPFDIAPEQERLIAERSSWLKVYVVGPNETDDRVDVTVAVGSFAAAEARDTDVITELAPRVPVTIVEGVRPVPAVFTRR